MELQPLFVESIRGSKESQFTPSHGMNLAEQAEKTLIAADMRLWLAVNINPRFRRIQGVAALALMPFFSAFLLDSYKYLEKKSPELAKTITLDKDILKHSRLRLKPLEMNGKKFGEILKDTNELARIHSNSFYESHPRILKPILKFVQKDLGIFFMDDEVISTTHLTLFNLGVTEEMLNNRSPSLRDLDSFVLKTSEAYGRYTSELYVALAEEVVDVVGEVQSSLTYQMLALGDLFGIVPSGNYKDHSLVDMSLSIPYRDLNMEPFYEQIAKAQGREQTAVFILFLAALSQVNTARVLVPKVSEDMGLAALKVRFLSLYHASDTLRRLSNESEGSNLIHPQALDRIRQALKHRSVRRIRKMDNLRDNLIHYEIQNDIVPRLSKNLPLSGLVEAHTSGSSLGDLWNEVSAGLDHVAKTLNSLLPDNLASRARVD